jgi:beta-glucosidase/6-phospho-beta-glucosidase/beta-galactosidase
MLDPEAFFWATGIEDTFITDPWHKTGRSLDEYELTRHYQNWETDLHLVSELGVTAARYGIPWYKANPLPQQYDWEFADRVFGRMAQHKVEPIVDLVHYGTPEWMTDSFLNPDYPDRIADYAGEMAARYKGQIHWYTPLNEPRITAYYTGRIGWWPPYKRTWKGFCQIMVAVCKGIVETCRRLHEVDPDIVLAHVDPTDLYFTYDSSLDHEVELRQHMVFLALDLISGKVDDNHPLTPWLLKHGVPENDLQWFRSNTASLDVIGINMYPMFSWKRVIRTPRGVRMRLEYAPGRILGEICEMYHKRYQKPLFISETAAWGSMTRRGKWLKESVETMKDLREKGIPMVGYTWWPLFSLVAWGYRQHGLEFGRYLLHMGLWDLDPDEDLARVRTPLVDLYKKTVDSKSKGVGELLVGVRP